MRNVTEDTVVGSRLPAGLAGGGATGGSDGRRGRPALRVRARSTVLALLRMGYRGLKASPARGLIQTRAIRRLRRGVVVGMRGRDVLEVLDILERGGVPCWLVGGWGVDALAGRQTREHDDVDLGLERRFLPEAVGALERAGFAVTQAETFLPRWMPRLVVLHDAAGRHVELLAVELPAPPGDDGRVPEMRYVYDETSFATGTVDGRPVRCLSLETQRTFHRGYDAREHDLRVLDELAGVAPAAAA